MTKSQRVRLDEKSSELRIEELVIADDDVVDYFDTDIAEDPDKEDIKRVFRVGVQALRAAETANEIDYVKSQFKDFEMTVQESLEELQDELDATFKDENSELEQVLDGHAEDLEEKLRERLGDDGEFLREALHHEDKDSPLYSIKQQIRQLRDEIKESEGRETERRFSTRKGEDFEDQVESVLNHSLTGPIEQIERTGTQMGSKGDSKKGDFLITTEGDQRIAIEVKNRTGDMSQGAIGEYLTETLKNREADYAIMVMRNAEAVPTTKMGWFHEFDLNRLCVVLSEGPDEDVEWQFLRFAYNWSRARVAQSNLEVDDEIDANSINEELESLRDQIDNFETIRNHAETITDEAQDITKQANKLERKIHGRLEDIKREISV